jgi:hypothetical protein
MYDKSQTLLKKKPHQTICRGASYVLHWEEMHRHVCHTTKNDAITKGLLNKTGGSNNQQQAPRNARVDRRGQPSHGSPAMQNPAAQSQLQTQQSMQQLQQMPAQVFREPYPQQTMMVQQPSGDFVYPWQLQIMQNSVPGGQSIYNYGQYLQSAMPQSGHRHVHLSQTMAQNNSGEGQQIQFIEPRPGLHPVVTQVAPQSKFFR